MHHWQRPRGCQARRSMAPALRLQPAPTPQTGASRRHRRFAAPSTGAPVAWPLHRAAQVREQDGTPYQGPLPEWPYRCVGSGYRAFATPSMRCTPGGLAAICPEGDIGTVSQPRAMAPSTTGDAIATVPQWQTKMVACPATIYHLCRTGRSSVSGLMPFPGADSFGCSLGPFLRAKCGTGPDEPGNKNRKRGKA
jgi:hypothetical protein